MPLTISQFNNLNFQSLYEWDKDNLSLPPGERGNTILVPVGFGFNYVWEENIRVQWTDRKVGSPTFGQARTQPSPNLKPEVVSQNPLQAADVRAGTIYVGDMLKAFKGWGAIWFIVTAQLRDLVVGGKYKLSWPAFPDLVMVYDGSTKVFADDPDAGYMRLRVEPGHGALSFANPDQLPNDTWYDGTDFAFGHWKVMEKVFDATQEQMTVAFEGLSMFGLNNSGFFLYRPTLEVVSSPGLPNTGDDVPEGTLLDYLNDIVLSSANMTAGVGNIAEAAANLKRIIGLP